MAGVCCEVVAETESAAAVEQNSRSSRRRRMDLRPCKLVSDASVSPPLENGRKRQKLDLGLILQASRDCDNAIENSESNQLNEDHETNESFNSNGTVELEIETEPTKFGLTSVCGRRRDMEDAVSIHPSFCKLSCEAEISSDTHFFGVFDGHGCSHVAMKCRDRFHEIIKEEIEACGGGKTVDWKLIMERGFERMDKEVQESTVDDAKENSNCRCELQTPECDAVGSTAVVAIVTPDMIIVANCGDSRAVLCRNGIALPLSDDHKPDRPDELLRIEEAGGRVIYWDGPRVLGVLAMSRAIGKFQK
ncbi:Protein phosphatase 2C 37 [Hibiscus syriacus]|uniref:protein-serine/threonine phosphatase n=1 Tax=Hibiscus syriacus TaxID=106335 RepID=A0A6A3B6Y1_HIBSY|nr:Protein phosphatase 2C 37 [Hibiscus syriacus]